MVMRRAEEFAGFAVAAVDWTRSGAVGDEKQLDKLESAEWNPDESSKEDIEEGGEEGDAVAIVPLRGRDNGVERLLLPNEPLSWILGVADNCCGKMFHPF